MLQPARTRGTRHYALEHRSVVLDVSTRASARDATGDFHRILGEQPVSTRASARDATCTCLPYSVGDLRFNPRVREGRDANMAMSPSGVG